MNKQLLHEFIDSDAGGNIITSIVLFIISLILFFPNPLKIHNKLIRYFVSIFFAVVTTLLITDLLLSQSVVIFNNIMQCNFMVAMSSMLIAFFSSVLVCLSVRRYKVLFCSINSSYLNNKTRLYTRFLELIYFIPVLLIIYFRVYLFDLSFATPAVRIIISSIIVIPVIEELMFRVLLPKLIRSEEIKYYDVLILSMIFQIVHFDANNLMPFILSLYLYLIILRTGKMYIVVLIHALLNFSFYFFPYS